MAFDFKVPFQIAEDVVLKNHILWMWSYKCHGWLQWQYTSVRDPFFWNKPNLREKHELTVKSHLLKCWGFRVSRRHFHRLRTIVVLFQLPCKNWVLHLHQIHARGVLQIYNFMPILGQWAVERVSLIRRLYIKLNNEVPGAQQVPI